jgi:predicted GIY-YIG superfamily endonuclease
VQAPDGEINRTLLNARKGSDLKGLKSKRVVVRGQENFSFASEVAIRFLERRDEIALDQVLCDPQKALEFDAVAQGIVPGYSSFQYRWAALSLRKRRRLAPELVAKVMKNVIVTRAKVSELDIEAVPNQPGIYLFHDSVNSLYAGEATNLYKRVKKHLDHSDRKGLAHWLWEHGATDLHLELHVLPAETSTVARKALELELIRSRRPIFNVAGHHS